MAEATATPVAALPRFQVISGITAEYNTITVNVQNPDRGAGYDTNDLRKWFKEDLLRWLVENGETVKGKTLRLSGAAALPNGIFFGFAVAKLGAERVQQSTMTPGQWLTIAAHDDPEAPLPVVYEPGQVVRARVFGHEVSNLVIRSYSLGDQFQVCGTDNREQCWVAKTDIIRFERRLSRYEESSFSEIPHFRRPFDDLGVRNGNHVRFILFGKSCTGRITALRPASCNIVAESGNGHEQVAVLVPLDNVKEVF